MALVALASTLIYNPSTFHTGYINESANEVYVTDYSSGKFRRYSMTTFAQVGSSSLNSNTYGVTLINSASAVTLNTLTSQVQFIELSSGYVQSVSTSGAGGPSGTNSQNTLIANDLVNEQVMWFNSATNVVYRINNNFTVNAVQVNTGQTTTVNQFSCIVNKSAGRYLLGSYSGQIFDIDSNGNILDQLVISTEKFQGLNSNPQSSTANTLLVVSSLYLDNNILTVGCGDGTVFVYDWTTKTKLYQYQHAINSQNQGTFLAPTGSGTAILGWYSQPTSSPGGAISEVDTSARPLDFLDSLYMNTGGTTYFIGVNSQTGVGCVVGTDSSSVTRVYFFRVDNTRATTTRTFTVQKDGVDQKARLILLEESGGSMVGRPLLDTYMQSPATYRVPTGKTIYEIVKIGEGEDATWDVSSYST